MEQPFSAEDISRRGEITGREIRSLMRRCRITIREQAARTQIPQQRIRRIRDIGLTDRHAIRDWIEAITGEDPGPL